MFAPDTALNRWFRTAYADRYGTPPTYPSYKMAQAILGLKAATEKAAAGKPERPGDEGVIAAFENLSYEAPSGQVDMKIGKGHQAVQSTGYGRFKFDPASGQPTLTDVIVYPADCVNPPEGVKSEEWIKGGFKGAKCP